MAGYSWLEGFTSVGEVINFVGKWFTFLGGSDLPSWGSICWYALFERTWQEQMFRWRGWLRGRRHQQPSEWCDWCSRQIHSASIRSPGNSPLRCNPCGRSSAVWKWCSPPGIRMSSLTYAVNTSAIRPRMQTGSQWSQRCRIGASNRRIICRQRSSTS